MNLLKRNQIHGGVLIFYLFLVISIHLFILCDGQVSLPFVLSQLLVLTVLSAICPFLWQKISCFKIRIQGQTDKKQGIYWGLIFFVAAFAILYCWYRAFYPGGFSGESIDQYHQALSGEYTSWLPLLQTWITFTLPLKLVGTAGSIVLFQIVEYSAVIAYLSYVLFRYGGRRMAVLSFLYIMLNPATGNMAVCPWSDTTFAMFALLLMTLGLQIHMTDGGWLDSWAARLFLILVLVAATFVSHRGILLTVPFLLSVLFCMDRKKKVRFLLLFLLGMDVMRSCLYLGNPGAAKIWNYEAEQIRFPVGIEGFRLTDMVYAIDGEVDWGLSPEMAENDLGLEWQESRVRTMLQGYTEYSRSSILKYIFWSVGIINLMIIAAGLCKCRLRRRRDRNLILFVLPVLCYSFGTMLLMTWNEFRLFHMNFLVLPVVLLALFGQRTEETPEEMETAAAGLPMAEEDRERAGRTQYILAVLYTGILFLLNGIRIFNINFWSDEGYSIMLSKMSFFEMLDMTAADVHPPLYYLLLQIISRIMGGQWISYRLLSLIPYGILLVFAMTVVWKKFGKETALIWITFSSLLNTAVEYNVQTRMYSWGVLFVMMSFYCLHGVLKDNRIKDYAGFVAMSLCAAYTHYYCLVSVAFFYLVLILAAAVRRREYLSKVLISCAVTIAAYLPWFFVLLRTFERTSESFWMTGVPNVKDCLLYLFSNRYQTIFLVIFLITTVIFVTCETGILKWECSGNRKVPVSLRLSDFHVDKNTVWMTAGFVSVFGTIVTGIMVSQIFRPMFIFRYIYPVSSVAWLLFGIGLKKYRNRAVFAAMIVILILKGGLPYYITNYDQERQEEDGLRAVLAATEGEVMAGDVILTDNDFLHWVNIRTYYPQAESRRIDPDELGTPDQIAPDRDTDYWMFIENEIDAVKAKTLEAQGFQAVSYVDNGNLGRIQIHVYKLARVR